MKKLITFLAFAASLAAQVPCTITGTLTTASATVSLDNRRTGCYQWRVAYNSTGFSALSIQLESSPDNSTWSHFTGATVVIDGSNPSTATTFATIGIHSNASFVRLNLSSATGSGSVTYQVWGANSVSTEQQLAGVTSVTATAPITATVSGGTTNISATYQGTGLKVQASTGTTTSGDCVQFDASGNTVDSGSACAGGSGPAFLIANGTGTTISAVTAGSGPTAQGYPLSYDAHGNAIDSTLQGSGGASAKVQMASGSFTSGHCIQYDASGNTTDAGAVCGTGGTGALTQIAQQTLGSAAATVTFSGISGIFTNLELDIMGRGDTAATDISVDINFNGDFTSDYGFQYILGIGATASAGNGSGSAFIGDIPAASEVGGFPGNFMVRIFNYAGTTFYKTGLTTSFSGNATSFPGTNSQMLSGGFVWGSMSAITSLTLTIGAGNFVAGSVFTLYGMQ